MKYLVTGGLGVIGSRIAARLMEDRHDVLIVDACEAPRNRWISRQFTAPSFELFRGRLEQIDAKTYASLLQGVDRVIHCAASTGIPHSVLHPEDDWRSNVDATRVLLEAIRRTPRAIPTVVLSSIKPYRADVMPELGLAEDALLEPDEPYAASKAAQSMLAMAYARSYTMPIVTFRCSNLYGPAPCHGPRHGWLTWFAISAATGRPINVQGNGQQSRDMLHADDVYSACEIALADAQRLRGRVFNLGGGAGNRITVGQAAAELVAMAGGGEIKAAPARAMDDLHVFVNTGAFLRETGWRPRVSVLDGMRSTFEWARENADELRQLYEGV